jgi:hypothetical protein
MTRNTASELVIGGATMTLRNLDPSDRESLLSLHRSVFGTTVDEDWYRWKYLDGQSEGMGVWHEGTLIAHCGGIPRNVLHQGARARDLQIGDVMVAPEWRGVLTRRGPFFHVCDGMYSSRLGVGKRFKMGFGFPSARHFRLAVKAGLSWDAGSIAQLRWSTPLEIGSSGLGLSAWHWRVDTIEPKAPHFDDDIYRAWSAMLRHVQRLSIGERDAGYVRWRYVDRPAYDPIFLKLRRPWSKHPVGVAVMSRPSASDPVSHWLDWIGPPPLMVVACMMCRIEAARQGAAGLTAWASHAVELALADTGVAEKQEAALIGVPLSSDLAECPVTDLNWWFMGGDTDFL